MMMMNKNFPRGAQKGQKRSCNHYEFLGKYNKSGPSPKEGRQGLEPVSLWTEDDQQAPSIKPTGIMG